MHRCVNTIVLACVTYLDYHLHHAALHSVNCLRHTKVHEFTYILHYLYCKDCFTQIMKHWNTYMFHVHCGMYYLYKHLPSCCSMTQSQWWCLFLQKVVRQWCILQYTQRNFVKLNILWRVKGDLVQQYFYMTATPFSMDTIIQLNLAKSRITSKIKHYLQKTCDVIKWEVNVI